MNWDALGAIGEITGAVAVFVTLVYLAIQIKQNTKFERANALDSSIRTFGAIRETIFTDRELSALYLKGAREPESLDEEETLRFRLLMHNVCLSFWHIYSQSQYTELPGDIWEVQETGILRVLSLPGGKWFWENYRLEFPSPFRAEVERILERNS